MCDDNMKNVVVKSSKIHGKGVFANRRLLKDDTILEIDDSHIVNDALKLTKEQYEYELDFLANGKIVIMQPPEKHINHSCNPNVYDKTVNGIRQVFAMRDIEKGEEITFDYSINGYNEVTFNCNCGSENCRKVYNGNFFKLPLSLQKKYIVYLDDWFIQQFKEKMDNLISQS